ncbi:MAG: hypothetical protein WCO23_02415 [bacterium]
MKVLLPEKGLVGPCFGVIRGLRMIKSAIHSVEKNGGRIVYHEYYMTKSSLRYAKLLEEAGLPVRSVESPDYGACDILSISPYGAPPSAFAKDMISQNRLLDSTCPIVAIFYQQVAEMTKQHRQVLIIGSKDDYESQTALKYSQGKATIISSCKDLDVLNWQDDFVILSQTTFPRDLFFEIVDKIRERASKAPVIIETGCPAWRKRVSASVKLGKDCQTLVIIGDDDSSFCSYVERLLSNTPRKIVRLDPDGELPDIATISTWAEPIGIVSSVSVTEPVIEKLKNKLEGI